MSDPRKKIITNRAEYERRAKAYSDSLDLYNAYFKGQGPFMAKNDGNKKGFVKHSSLQGMLNKLASDSGADIRTYDTAQEMAEKSLLPFPNVKNNQPIGWYYTISPKNKYYSVDETTERHNAIFAPAFKKPTVEPVLGAEKAEVPSKGMDLKVTTKNKVMKSLPRQIDKVAYDASGTKVYITVNGQTSAINKTHFPAWRQANQGLWDAYIKNK